MLKGVPSSCLTVGIEIASLENDAAKTMDVTNFSILKWVTGQKPLDNKPPRIIEEVIPKYAVDAYLFRLGSTNAKENSTPGFFEGGFYAWGLLSGGDISLGTIEMTLKLTSYCRKRVE